jgi:hypothetical protein
MRWVLLSAAVYHILFAVVANFWPYSCFDWLHIARPNHVILWRVVGIAIGILGLAFLFGSRNPTNSWGIVLAGIIKFSVGIGFFVLELQHPAPSTRALWLLALDSIIWWPPFLAILWASLQAHAGVPPTRNEPYSISEAAGSYQLSNGQSLAEASDSRLLALVFLRHFGCTFTRQILRGLEVIEKEARQHGAELVLVHMLQNGKETQYLGERSGVTRIADPRCELYRAFGLGKGGFIELFGPQVWWRAALSIFKGCGVGHLAGDGLQMPGAFLFHQGKIVAAQPAHSSSDLPDLEQLFKALPALSTPVTLAP